MKMTLNDRVKIKGLSNYDPLLDRLFISYSNLDIQGLMIVNINGRKFFTDIKDLKYSNYIKGLIENELPHLINS